MILHPSLRLKLSAAFAGAMAILLAGLGLFIYSRFQAGLDHSLTDSLRSRASDVRALIAQADTGLSDSTAGSAAGRNSGFAQVIRTDASVLDSTPGLPRRSLLTSRDLLRAARGQLLIDRANKPQLDGPVRLLASPVRAQDQQLIVVVGTSLRTRDAALGDLSALMLLGGPVALLLASVLGYAVSALALRTVETMRRRASALSVTRPGQRLPVPAANDELRSLAVTLNAMLERTEAAFARERRFVADASHELRTPLSILKAELEVALIGPGAEPELRAALASADAEADRVIRLAQDLLVLAQADHGSLPIEPADAYVKPMLERLQHKFAPRAQAVRRMVVSSAPDDLVVKADPARLEQALASLVDNALAHGTGSVALSALRKGHTVELHVADEGPGFPEPFLDIAFERFTRAEAGRTHEGTGLGLAIVRSIGRAHGGDAHVINRASGGADVWITLPQRETPSRRPAAGSQAPTNSACEMATRTM